MGRIGFLNESSSIYETMHDRFDGYLYAMRQAGIEPVPELVMPDAELVSSEFYNESPLLHRLRMHVSKKQCPAMGIIPYYALKIHPCRQGVQSSDAGCGAGEQRVLQ